VEIPRHWRMKALRLKMEGFQRTNETGGIEVSINGSSWYPLNGNDHNGHVEENPFQGQIIYQAPISSSIEITDS